MIEVELVFSKKARENPQPGRPSADVIMSVMSTALRERMRRGGYVRRGTNWAGYSTKKNKKGRGFLVHPDYPVKSSVTMKHGIGVFRSSAHMHSAVKPGSFWVTGGMWMGLKVWSNGRNRAVMRFMGRSHGYSIRWKRSKGRAIRRTVNGVKKTVGWRGGGSKVRKQKINNALKAWSVFQQTQVNVLDYSDDEYEALTVFWAYYIEKVMDYVLGGQIEWTSTAQLMKSRLATRLFHEFKHDTGGPFRID